MELIKWNNAKKAIAECKTIDEVINIKDKAEAMRAYAKQVKESLEVQNDLCEIKLRAERKAGEILKDANIPKHNEKNGSQSVTRLSDIGIAKHESSRWQKIANIPENNFEKIITETKEQQKELTESMMLKFEKEIIRNKNISEIKTKINSENLKINNKYDIVILDPPWSYDNDAYDKDNNRGVIEYPTQTKDEIYNTCKNFFKNDCVLWLWTTHKFIWEAKELIDLWNFDYKCILVWDKIKMGIGRNLRLQTEFCLLAKKGNPVWNLTDERDIIKESRREHSRKPDSFYELVKKISYGTIFEYYSRENREGIINAGYEANKF